MRPRTRRFGAELRRAVRFAEPGIVVVLAIALLETLTRTDVLPPGLPPPTAIGHKFVEDIQGAVIWQSTWLSLKAWAFGFAIVTGIGVTVGLLLGYSRVTYRAVILTAEFVRAIPSIGALPFLVLLYGVGFKVTVVFIVLGALWPLLIQTMYGAQDVDPVALDTGRIYGLGRFGRFFRIVLPSAAPYIGTGMRLSGVHSILIAVAASLLIGGEGLGAAIALAEAGGQIELTYARIFMTGCLGLSLTIVLTRIERSLLRWHPSMREVQV